MCEHVDSSQYVYSFSKKLGDRPRSLLVKNEHGHSSPEKSVSFFGI